MIVWRAICGVCFAALLVFIAFKVVHNCQVTRFPSDIVVVCEPIKSGYL